MADTEQASPAGADDGYKWVALANTTPAVFMSMLDVGRLGDMFGRVRIYNAGFAVFTFASVLLSFDPFGGGHGALWLIGWRLPHLRPAGRDDLRPDRVPRDGHRRDGRLRRQA
jgi:MFS family permease